MLVFLNGFSGLCRFQFGGVEVSGLGCLTLRTSSSSSSLSEAFEYALQRRFMSLDSGALALQQITLKISFSCSNFRDQCVYTFLFWSLFYFFSKAKFVLN